MRKRTIISILALTAGSLLAGSGYHFLRTEKSPSVIATAQTSYLFRHSAENSGFNQASSLGADRINSSFSYRSLFQDADVTQLAVSYREEKNMYALELSYMNISGIEGRDIPSDDPLYEFGSKNLIFSAGYAYGFDSGIKFGLNGKYLFEKIEFEDAYGFAFSAGLFRENNFAEGLSFGLAVNNLGSMNKLENEKTELPSDLLFGIGYSFAAWSDMEINLGNSSRYLFSDSEFENFTGIEIGYLKKFFVRSGYRASNEGTPFSAGIGFVINEFGFDYAYTPFSEESVNDSHSLSLSYTLK
jgi:hypothetical protein